MESGFHTAMETSGYAQWDTIEELLRYLDLVYVDIKHMSSERHAELTGKGNEQILENIKKIAEKNPDTSLIIRIPVIPGFNDSPENIRNTAKFVRNLKRVDRIELLPYHRYGVFMYPMIFRHYPLQDVEVPLEDHLTKLEKIIKSCDVPVQIGG